MNSKISQERRQNTEETNLKEVVKYQNQRKAARRKVKEDDDYLKLFIHIHSYFCSPATYSLTCYSLTYYSLTSSSSFYSIILGIPIPLILMKAS